MLFRSAGFGAPARPIHESDLRDFLLATQPDLVRGDVLLTPDQLRNGIIGDRYRWPNGVIIYQLDPAFSKIYDLATGAAGQLGALPPAV